MGRPASDLPVRIVHAARARFLAEGVDGASLRNIARDAGTSIGMVYYYYPSKDDLFLAVVEEVYAQLLAGIGAALARATRLDARVRELYARFAAMSDDELTIVRLVVREALGSSVRRRQLLERFARGHVPLLLAAVGDGLARGELDPEVPAPVTAVAIVVLGLIPQVIGRLAADTLPAGVAIPDPATLADALTRIVLAGVARPPCA